MIRAAARRAESELAYLDNVRQAAARSPVPARGWRPGGADGLPPGHLQLANTAPNDGDAGEARRRRNVIATLP